MNIKIFDIYNIRARLSVYSIIVAPMLLTLYLLYEPLRSIAFSTVVIGVLTAFSNYLFALQRYLQKDKKYENTAAEFLFVSDTHIGDCTKQRYYSKLSKIDKEFEIFETPCNSDKFKSACYSAVHWLRNNTRDNKLVQEENMMCGFYRNLLSLRGVGVIFSVLSILILLFSNIPESFKELIYQKSNLGMCVLDIFFLIFWIFGINKKMYVVLTEKYAYALLGALDTLEQ